jgi:hypothetical protein
VTPIETILLANQHKLRKALVLLAASTVKYRPFDPTRAYTPDDLEPYDALADRFMRAVEIALKYFRSRHMHDEGSDTDTVRDLLLYAEKRGLITSAELWMEMRNLRIRIVHDYLPDR